MASKPKRSTAVKKRAATRASKAPAKPVRMNKTDLIESSPSGGGSAVTPKKGAPKFKPGKLL